MKIGDVSRSRRFANPARLRWYAFHRSVRFALRMMKAEETPSPSDVPPLALVRLPAKIASNPVEDLAPDLTVERGDQNESLL
jgi:hypothetical protein